MKIGKILMFTLMTLLIFVMSVSCTSSGQYMALSNDEMVIGTVQVTFAVRSTALISNSGKDAVNTQAYIRLLEAASREYSGYIDIRDVFWESGRSIDNENTEISAIGKVIQAN